MSRRRLMAALVVVAVAAAAVVFVLRPDDGPDGPRELERDGSRALREGEALEIRREPARYRIVYRVSDPDGVSTTEVVEVERPFASTTTTYAGDSTEGDPIAVDQTAFGRVAVGTESGEGGQVLAVGPTLAGSDVRLGPALEEALELGLLERREQREVAGRRCQVYRAGASVFGGALSPPGDPQTEYADACFDERGLLLEEWWVVDGAVIRQRLAVEVDERPPSGVAEDLVDAPTSIEVDRGGGSILEIEPESAPPGTFFVVDEVPSGFEHRGRYSVIPPQGEAFNDPASRGKIQASTADVWVRGIDLLVVDQGGTLHQQAVFALNPDHATVELPIGTGEVIVGLNGNEVRVLLEAGRFVRVHGTLPTDELVAIARALVETQGTEIVVKN